MRMTAYVLDAVRKAAPGHINRAWPNADQLVDELTGFSSVADMLARSYCTTFRPTCRIDLDPRFADLADIFDAAMIAMADPRRAYRIHLQAKE
ncbi:MAG: hypothetical protein QNJ44_16265 [Rhodobacter sp.]|nr:hypothetical protein [Rhodobacter sp.]